MVLLYEKSEGQLTMRQNVQAARVLTHFTDVFAKHDLDLGHFTGVEHKITTTDDNPVREKMRRTPLE